MKLKPDTRQLLVDLIYISIFAGIIFIISFKSCNP